MTKVQTFTQKSPIRASGARSRNPGLLALVLILASLLVACGGGSTPPGASTDPPAVSQDEPAPPAGVEEEPAAPLGSQNDATGQDGAASPARLPGSEEFGLTMEELVHSAEVVEAGIASCMRDAGFEYVPVDFLTVRKSMLADKSAPGLTDDEFRSQYGYGISTGLVEAGAPPQRAGASHSATIGLGEQNVQIFSNLSEADQVAYNRTLFGENSDATFAVTLEAEDFSETGGCTRRAIEQVFDPEELSASYYNPGDALIEQDPRVIAAITDWSSCMREAGFDYNNPEEIEPDLKERFDAITGGADPDTLSAEGRDALTELRGEERAIAVADFECEEEFIEPAVIQVEAELYGAPQN